MQAIGQITLNTSLLIYLIYFLPQIIHNQWHRKTAQISVWTHWGMLCANSFDLIYGYGYQLPWQYLTVTWISLTFIMLQQWQIYLQSQYKGFYQHMLAHGVLIVAIVMAMTPYASSLLWILGFISVGLYSLYWLPQIIKNAHTRKAEGFSVWFIVLNFTALGCDLCSALIFGWPLPSLISPIVIMVLLSVLMLQYHYYSLHKIRINIQI